MTIEKRGAAGGNSPKEASLKELLERQLELVDLLDQVVDELGVQYGELVMLQGAIARQLPRESVMPAWITESWLKEALRNRLAMELAEHSSGSGNQTILGPVMSRETLLASFQRIANPVNLTTGGAA